jgi:hypothetical protein
MTSSPTSVITRLHQALNDHDLDAFVACFDPDYRSEQPVHPNRAFNGNEQVRTNWAIFFAGVPDLHAELLRAVAEGDVAWSEWTWTGHRGDGSTLDMSGVMITGISHDRIAWARLYMEEVEQESPGIDATVQHLAGT